MLLVFWWTPDFIGPAASVAGAPADGGCGDAVLEADSPAATTDVAAVADGAADNAAGAASAGGAAGAGENVSPLSRPLNAVFEFMLPVFEIVLKLKRPISCTIEGAELIGATVFGLPERLSLSCLPPSLL